MASGYYAKAFEGHWESLFSVSTLRTGFLSITIGSALGKGVCLGRTYPMLIMWHCSGLE